MKKGRHLHGIKIVGIYRLPLQLPCRVRIRIRAWPGRSVYPRYLFLMIMLIVVSIYQT